MNDVEVTSVGENVMLQALTIMRPLVTWLLRSGVGYTKFAAALKPLFLEAALAEHKRIGGKQTDSAPAMLSLLSGLHPKDVRGLMSEVERRGSGGIAAGAVRLGKPSPATGVGARRLADDRPGSLPHAGSEGSFEALARSVSMNFHPRSVLQELIRLGVAEQQNGCAKPVGQAFVPGSKHAKARELQLGSVADPRVRDV